MIKTFLALFLLLSVFTVYGKEKLEIISNYPLPENNIQEVYRKTGSIKQVIDFLEKTDDFERVIYRNGKLILKRKLRLKKVVVRGNNSFWKREILAITGLLEKYPVDKRTVHNIYTRLKKFYMDNGFPYVQVFVDAEADKKGDVVITIEIQEGPEVEVGRLIIYSSYNLPENLIKKLKKSFGVEKGELFNLSKISASVDNIQQFLYAEGYYDSFVNIVSFRPSGKDRLDVVLYVDAGMRYLVSFTGNKSFDSTKLKKLVTFQENGFNYYQLVRSTENIEKFYRSMGYLDAKVIPTYSEDFDRQTTTVVFSIIEGERYRIENVATDTDLPEVEEFFSSMKGRYFMQKKIEKFLKQLSDRYFYRGFLNVSYSVEKKINREKKTVDLYIRFFKGKKYILRSVRIKELPVKLDKKLPSDYDPFFLIELLDKTKKELKNEGYFDGDAFLDVSFKPDGSVVYADAVIEVKKGERYSNGVSFIYGTWHLSPVIVEKNLSRQQYYSKEEFDSELDFLYYTNIFDSINPYLEIDRKEKKVNKLFILHEDKRGSFQGQVGYSTEQKLKLSAAVRLKNLFRYGFETSAYLEKTDLGFFYKLSFGNRVLPKRTGAFISYYRTYQYHSIYDLKAQGYELTLTRKPNKWIKQDFLLSYAKNSLQNQTVYPDSTFNTLKVRFTITDDHRTPKTNPKKGYYITGYLERELKDIKFNKIYLSGRYYLSFLFFTFTQRITGGYIYKKTDRLPLSERFFLGGISNFRGFGYEKVAGVYGTGGNSLVLMNTEIRYPLFPSFNLYGFSFIDAGNVYPSYSYLKQFYLRKTAGTGVYVPTPVGSFVLDVAFKLDRKTGESLYRLEFSINTLF
ncbi:BamA/OMP85 family outer membrane protein [Persephonella sp.]